MSNIILRKHQNELLHFARSNGMLGVMAWHGMGLGKTLSSLRQAEYHLDEIVKRGEAKAPKVLVLCPKSAMITWREEIKANAKNLLGKSLIYSISSLHHAMASVRYNDIRYIIIDEAHAFKSPETTRIEVLSKFLTLLGTEGSRFRGGQIMLLSGTPMPNGAHELYIPWALCCAPDVIEAAKRIMDKDRYKMWADTYAGKKTKSFFKGKGKKVNRSTPEGASTDTIDQLGRLLALFTHYRRVEDCLDIPKPKEYHVNLGLPDDKLLSDANIEEPEAYMAVVERLSRAKTPHMLGWIQEFLRVNPTTQIIVFTMHRAPLDALVEYFKQDVRIITGREKRDDRDRSIFDFKKNKFRIFGMTYKCGSESLNLQNSFNSLYHGYPWTDSTLRQAMARTYRSGQERETNHFFLTSGSNDSRILGIVRRKQEATNAVEDKLIELELKSKTSYDII